MQSSSRWPSPELAFVARASGSTAAAIDDHGVRDWSAVVELALRHRVLPRVWRNAGACIPEPHAQQMRDHVIRNSCNALQIVAETLTAVQLLHDHGISALVLKGPFLARQLYGDYSLRVCTDIDLLVRAQDFVAAAQALAGAGYQHHTPLTATALHEHRKFEHDITFVCNNGGILLELHADVAQPHYSYRVDLEMWWQRAASMAVGSRNVAVLCLEHAYLLNVLHAAKHHWHRLDLIADIAAFQCLPMDWSLVQNEARVAGMRRVLEISGMLATWMFNDAPWQLPSGVAAGIMRKVLTGSEFGRFDGVILDMRMRERLQDRARYLIRRALATRRRGVYN